MAAFEKVMSGIPALDQALDYIRMGDNVVWRVYNPELSYGSHIFQDLVEAQILYTAVFDDQKTVHFHPELLRKTENMISAIPQGPKWQDVVRLTDVSGMNCMLYHDLTNERVLLCLEQ